jgi:cobalt/nickel transport system permease protein
MGITFVRGSEMNQQMYEAMQCRGFTGDYNGL